MATGGQQRAARTTPGPLARVYRSWRGLAPEQRISALAALSLWVTMFLPWYSETGIFTTNSRAVSVTLTAFDAFSFVELAVLLVSAAVLALLFARGERRAFHLPGGDGTVILVAGAWVGLLIFYRMLDKSSLTTNGKTALLSTGIQWGIFLALGAAVWLAWTGLSMRRSHRAEPALTDDPTVPLQTRRFARRERDDVATERSPSIRPTREGEEQRGEVRRADEAREPAREHRGVTREDAEQLSFDLPHDHHDE
jgi:hypothetical protein